MSSLPGISFIGVGNMGLAAVLALLKSGYPVTIWNRTTSRPQVKAAVDAGALFEEEITEVVAGNDTVMVCLLDYKTINKAFQAVPRAAFAGKTVVNLTNGTLEQARELQSWAQEAGVRGYFDCAIMVTPQMVGGSHSFLVFSGGDEKSVLPVSEALTPIGRPQYLGKEISAAARFDLAALSSMYGMFAGSFIGMALMKRGPGRPSVGTVVKNEIVPFLQALVPYLGHIAEAWDEERWEDNMGNPVGMQVEGVRNIMTACRDEGVDASMLEGLLERMERVVDVFGTDAGVTAVGKFLM